MDSQDVNDYRRGFKRELPVHLPVDISLFLLVNYRTGDAAI